MRWPYNARVDSVHAWGTAAAGIAIVGIIVGALAATHANDQHFRWWWPTNWLIVPVGIIVMGLIMVVLPLRRRNDQDKDQPPPPQGSPQIAQLFEQNITASASGAMAQGAAFGNVINEATQSGHGPTEPAVTEPTDKQP